MIRLHIGVPTAGMVSAGFAVSLARTLARLQPWFLPKFLPEECDYTTEDVPFFEKARGAGYDVWVDHDVSKQVGHTGKKVWYLNEYVSPEELNQA